MRAFLYRMKKQFKNNSSLREKRIEAGIIDMFFVACMSGLISVIIDFIVKNNSNMSVTIMENMVLTRVLELAMYYTIISLVVLLEILIFSGSSIGKKMTGIEVKYKKKYKVGKVRLFFRRFLSFVFYPINIVMFLAINKTLCDIIFNTEVVEVPCK